MLNEPIVRRYRVRADSFFRAASDLVELTKPDYSAAIGLLAVHASIAFADAVLVSVGQKELAAQDHAQAGRRLRSWCTAKALDDRGIKHFDWLISKKNHFSYDDREVTSSELQTAFEKMRQFFAWMSTTFREVAQMEAEHA